MQKNQISTVIADDEKPNQLSSAQNMVGKNKASSSKNYLFLSKKNRHIIISKIWLIKISLVLFKIIPKIPNYFQNRVGALNSK